MSSPFHYLRKLYHTAVPLQLKYGSTFRKALSGYEANLSRSREEIEDYQWSRLKALIDYAYQHVPYYTRKFREKGISPADIQHWSDFKQIPVLAKDDVDLNREELKSDEFDKFDPISTITSGTTRDGLLLYRSRELEAHRNAIVWRYRRSIGYDFRQRRARLTTAFHKDQPVDQFPIDLNENCIYVHPHAINRDLARTVYEQIRDFRPRMIQAQPASAAILASLCRELDLEPLQVPIFLSIGELIYPEYRKLITEFYGGTLYNYYGNRENTAAAGSDHAGNLLIFSDYCYLEFDDDSANDPGNDSLASQGNIISTSLDNYAFPLIRYHTEDLGRYFGYQDDSPYPFPAMEVLGGRGKDLILTRNGLKLPYISSVLRRNNLLIYHRVQLEQVSGDEIIVRIVPSQNYNENRDRKLVETAFFEEFKGEFKIAVEVVDKIEATSAGKYRSVISKPAMDALRKSLD